jgi:hypothetical protein
MNSRRQAGSGGSAKCPLRVKLDQTQFEHNQCALRPFADGADPLEDVATAFEVA